MAVRKCSGIREEARKEKKNMDVNAIHAIVGRLATSGRSPCNEATEHESLDEIFQLLSE